MAERANTKMEAVCDSMRADILAGELKPGQRLPFAQLRERYGSSVGVLREALMRLVEEGFLVSEPQQGFLVKPLLRSEMLELTEARSEIESLVVRLSVERGDLTWESKVVAAHHVLSRYATEMAERHFDDEWVQLHEGFHDALLSGCGNERLYRYAKSLRQATELYRRWSRELTTDEPRDIAGEHQAILDAVVRRDADAAARILRHHIETTTLELRDVISVEGLHDGAEEDDDANGNGNGAARGNGGGKPRSGARSGATR